MIPLYFAAIGVVMLANAIWRWRQRDVIRMAASALMAGLALATFILPIPDR
ncbi:hypothetical protein [Mesorhizobium sp. WSM3859]|uniref:hypothetical protein n=1 Tax=Mesorhizobium sp. WSM3859 TaxID=2029402 RepID=UPI0015968DCE|nr:hypothetical protein [Mesorhizobium sp. WSM3859]